MRPAHAGTGSSRGPLCSTQHALASPLPLRLTPPSTLLYLSPPAHEISRTPATTPPCILSLTPLTPSPLP
ncbi:hypothetical protein VTO73DRAFT_3419 [Trametes versicolor]